MENILIAILADEDGEVRKAAKKNLQIKGYVPSYNIEDYKFEAGNS